MGGRPGRSTPPPATAETPRFLAALSPDVVRARARVSGQLCDLSGTGRAPGCGRLLFPLQTSPPSPRSARIAKVSGPEVRCESVGDETMHSSPAAPPSADSPEEEVVITRWFQLRLEPCDCANRRTCVARG